MMALAYYLLKVLACSGLLYGYYQLALKNKAFHQWNRFYLLFSVVFALVIPWLQITISNANAADSKTIQLIQVVQSANNYLEAITISSGSSPSPEQWVTLLYSCVAGVFLLSLIASVYKILQLAGRYGVQVMGQIKFVNTREPGTPFSFLNYIFWNKEIPLHSEAGRHIFQHELVHVQEKHTLDKLFMQLVVIPFWCNPFFWLVRKELRFIHEFIADRKAVGENGTAAFAAMILQASYPTHYKDLTNPFFQTSIKRRIAMLTKIQNPVLNYVSRVIALPLIALTIFAFTFRTNNSNAVLVLDKEIIVAIDAGHGFKNGGPSGVSVDGVSEDALVLQLAEQIKALNKNEKIKLVLTRNGADLVDLPQRLQIAQQANADLFISLHVNADLKQTTSSGIQVYLPVAGTALFRQSQVLGSAILSNLRTIYTADANLTEQKTGIYVLNKNTMPAVLIELGYLTNSGDRKFISDKGNQQKIAQQILSAIETYAASNSTGKILPGAADTLPKRAKEISAVDVNTNEKTIAISYTDGTTETLTEQEAMKRGLINNGGFANARRGDANLNSMSGTVKIDGPAPLYVIGGKEVSSDKMQKIHPSTIESVNVLKGKPATDKYGDKGRNGVVEVTLKKAAIGNEMVFKQNDVPMMKGDISKLEITQNGTVRFEADNLTSFDTSLSMPPVFVQTEEEASIDKQVWRSFLAQNLVTIIGKAATAKTPPGTYVVNARFIVNADGTLSDITTLNDPGYGFAKAVINFLPDSPKWKPAVQNGQTVRSFHTQPITIIISAQ